MPAQQTTIWRETLRNHPRGLVVNTAAVAGATVILGQADSPPLIWAWAVLSLLYSLYRWGLYRACGQTLALDSASPRRRLMERLHRASVLGAGVLWALLAWWGIPYFAGTQQFAILVILSALAGGATGTLAPMRLVGKAYVLLMIVPACVQLLRQGGADYVSLAVLGVIFAWVMVSSHDNNHMLLLRAIELANENTGLVRDLSSKTHEVLQANAALEQRVQDRTRELQHMAHHDLLTGLLNRRGVLAMAEPMRREHASLCLSLVYVDLDRFKQINDGLGHEWGDALLKRVAERLGAASSALADALGAPAHLVGRWGGDEFVLALMHAADCPVAAHVQALLSQLAAPYQMPGHELSIGASLGCSRAVDSPQVPMLQALAEADLAASEAKRLGRGRVVMVSEPLLAAQRRRSSLMEGLKAAAQDDSLRLLFQPIVAAQGGAVMAYEALLRWHCSDVGPVSPAEFIPLAEECDLIDALGQWVLEQGCLRASAWPAHIKLAVNTSIKQLVLPDYASRVRHVLAQTGLPAQRLVIEVTESVFDELNTEQALISLLALRQMGAEIHVDDFGTGYSSLSRLREFPLDAVKIDKSFVLSGDERAVAVIEGTLLMAHRFGLRVIAEGVETAPQAAMLAALGVDELQGYLYGRPAERIDAEESVSRVSHVVA